MKHLFAHKYTEFIVLFLIICLSFSLKLWLTQNNHFLFWFNQARDAIVSQEMVQTHHLKIQGPSASGTQDTVYHGVIWYYFLAPLYTIFHGNPAGIIFVLALVTSLAIVPYYILVKEFAGSKNIALLASFLIAVSPDSITNSTWIANPVIAYCVIPLFYLSIWRGFFQRKYTWLIFAALTLGILQQSIVFLSYLWIVVILSYLYDWQKRKKQKIPLGIWIASAGVYLLSISTMILAQLKLILAGIYPLLTAHTDLMEKETVTLILGMGNLYFEKMRWVVSPQFPVFSVLICIGAMIITWKQSTSPKKYFLATWFFAPFALLLFHYRDAIHIILGTEWVFAFCIAFSIFSLCKKFQLKYFFMAVVSVVFVLQVSALKTMHQNEESFVGTQQGAWMDQQLAVIDKTYSLAAGKSFSISAFTNPYGYDTTWAYLYSWYGQQKYGYEPTFYGPDQTGIFGGNLLEKTSAADLKHFVIVEPINGIPPIIYDHYMQEQDANTVTPSANFEFGSIILQQRFSVEKAPKMSVAK